MNSLFIMFSALTFACSNGERKNIDGNNIENTETLDTVNCIKNIEKHLAEINAVTDQYDKVEKEIFGHSAEGGIMIAFYDNNDLKKIIATFYGETGQATTEYYFDTVGNLSFIFRKTSFYGKPMYVEDSKIESIAENRYYFCQNELIKWLGRDNKPVNPMHKEFQNETKFIKQDVEWLRKNIADYSPCENNQLQGDTVRCKYGDKCLDGGFILKGSREATGKVKHVRPKITNVPLEE